MLDGDDHFRGLPKVHQLRFYEPLEDLLGAFLSQYFQKCFVTFKHIITLGKVPFSDGKSIQGISSSNVAVVVLVNDLSTILLVS